MPLENPYCSLLSVQKETGNSDAELTEWFEECINGASRWIEDHCHTDFLSHDHSAAYLNIADSEAMSFTMYVPWPIITLTSVASADGEVEASRYTFAVGKRAIILRDNSNWLPKVTGRARDVASNGYTVAYGGMTPPLKVKGTFGYATPPMSVARACTKIASAWSHEKRRERVAQDGSRTSILDERIPDDAITLLKRFRRLVY